MAFSKQDPETSPGKSSATDIHYTSLASGESNNYAFGAHSLSISKRISINFKKHLDRPTHRENLPARLIKESTESGAIKHRLLVSLNQAISGHRL
jgi:hypothetical protein